MAHYIVEVAHYTFNATHYASEAATMFSRRPTVFFEMAHYRGRLLPLQHARKTSRTLFDHFVNDVL